MGSKTTQLLGGLLGSTAGASIVGGSAAVKALTPDIPGGKAAAGPKPEDIEQERLAREEEDRKRRESQGRGASATIGTSSLGDTSRANTAANALLGVG